MRFIDSAWHAGLQLGSSSSCSVKCRFIALERPIVQAIWDVLPKDACTMRGCSCCAHKRASMLDFELLEKAAKADSAGMAAISSWLEKRVADFCRLTDSQVLLNICMRTSVA